MPATIVGTPNNDWLIGSEGDDVIVGLGGYDRIDGRGGDDLICGGGDHDEIEGGDGNDRIYGGAGSDWLVGGAGNDRIAGQRGNDALAGTNGRDRLIGGHGHDKLVGGIGADRLLGRQGADKCDVDTKDRPAAGCETMSQATYRTIKITLTGAGNDPTNSDFGDAYFAGTVARAIGEFGIPTSTTTLTGKAPFTLLVPTTSFVSLMKNFTFDSVATGGAPVDPSTPANITVQMYCCALY